MASAAEISARHDSADRAHITRVPRRKQHVGRLMPARLGNAIGLCQRCWSLSLLLPVRPTAVLVPIRVALHFLTAKKGTPVPPPGWIPVGEGASLNAFGSKVWVRYALPPALRYSASQTGPGVVVCLMLRTAGLGALLVSTVVGLTSNLRRCEHGRGSRLHTTRRAGPWKKYNHSNRNRSNHGSCTAVNLNACGREYAAAWPSTSTWT